MKPDGYFVYITTNASRQTLYIGVTNDLVRRMAEHRDNSEVQQSFAGRYGCYHLVYFESYPDPQQAILREKELKKWRREKKLALVESFNPEWRFLEHDVF